MADKQFQSVVINVVLKPYTAYDLDRWDEEIKAGNLDHSEDLSVALGKIHSWYSYFTSWVFRSPSMYYIPYSLDSVPAGWEKYAYGVTSIEIADSNDVAYYSEDYPNMQVGDLILHQRTFSLATHVHSGIEGYDSSYIGNWKIDQQTGDAIPVYTAPSGDDDYLSEFYSAGSYHWDDDPTNLEHPLMGIHMFATDKGACAHGEIMLLGDNDHVFFRSGLGFRGWSEEISWSTFNQNWHACMRASDVTCSDSSMTITPVNYKLNWQGAEVVNGAKQSTLWSKQVPVGITLSHTNSVTAQTTSGMYKFTYDANGHITGSTAVVKSDITALGIPGSNTDTKVTQNVTSASNTYPLLMSYYTTSSSTTTAQTVNRSNNLAFNPSSGELFLYRKGSYITTTDSSDTLFGLVCYNGSNVWVGSNQSATHHHTGATYISTGYNTSTNTGNPTFYAAVPNAANTGASSYEVLHKGNTFLTTSTNTNSWNSVNVTTTGYALTVIRGDSAANTPPYLAGNYCAGLVFGGSSTKAVISAAYDTPKFTLGGGQYDSVNQNPPWYFSLTGTTATTYNLDNFALASDYLPLAGGTMDAGAIVTVYTDQAETQGVQYKSTGQVYKIASGVGWARSVMAYKSGFSGDILGSYGIFGASDSFTNNRMNYFYIGKTYNDQWYEFGYGKHTIVDNDLHSWMLRYRYPWTSGSSTGTYEGSFISLYPYDRYGCCLVVGENTGGLTLIGGGEAAQQLRLTVTDASTSPYGNALTYGSESVMIGADTDLYFISGANTLTTSDHAEGTNLKTFIWSNSGTLRPWNDDTYSIGASTKRWNYGYFTNISGKLIGTIDSTTTGVTQNVSSSVDSSTKIATTQFAWRLKHRAGTFYNNPTSWSSATWGNVASVKYSSASNLYLTTVFLITSNYQSTVARSGMGILFVQFYATNTALVNYRLKWIYSDDIINNDTVVITHTADTSTSTPFSEIGIWVKCALARYQSISVSEIHEMNLSSYVGSSTWNLYSLTTGSASYPSGSNVTRMMPEAANEDQPLIYESASAATTSVTCTIPDLFNKWKMVYVCIQDMSFGSTATNAMNINFMVPLTYLRRKSQCYVLTTSQPSDWSTAYTSYYTYNSTQNTYTAVSGSSAPTWQANKYYKAGLTTDNPGFYVGEGYNPSNTGSSSATRLLVQYFSDKTIKFTHATGAKVGYVRIYGIS